MNGFILIPLNLSKTHYEGFIESYGQEYRIEVKFTEGKQMKDARIKCDWRLKQKLKNRIELIHSKLQMCSSISEFFREVKNVLNEVSHTDDAGSSTEYCTTIVKQIEELGWNRVNDINKDLTEITLISTDVNGREHTLTLHPTSNYPKECPAISVEFPLPFRPLWGGELSTLSKLYEQFAEVLPCYQRMWDDLDELKDKCWILEPENPTCASKEFRVALGTSSSILITVDPLHPENPPECRFLGSETAVLPVRERFLGNIQDWNETLSLYQNLKNILQVEFPQRKTNQSMDISLQCGICYSYRLGNAIPEQACNDARCGQLFHQDCLIEWIRSIPGAKQSFQTLFGECPYCDSTITVKLAARS